MDYDKLIDCAAIRCDDGRIWTGKRHRHCIQTIRQATGKFNQNSEQGFVTMAGKFVNRKEAAIIAVHSGQASLTLPCELFSEDLY